MSRCVICDSSSQGLSDYRPDGRFHASRFREFNGDEYCEECFREIDETLNEFYESDLGDEEHEGE